jgi:hypothetical protein
VQLDRDLLAGVDIFPGNTGRRQRTTISHVQTSFLNRTGGLQCRSELERLAHATAAATVARRWNMRLQLLPFPGSQSSQPELAEI